MKSAPFVDLSDYLSFKLWTETSRRLFYWLMFKINCPVMDSDFRVESRHFFICPSEYVPILKE